MDSYENEASKFAAQRTKLKNICEAHDLTYTFIKNSYPIKLIIRPIKGVGEQMSMLETASEDSYISPDAYLLFTMKDGVLVYRMSKTFTIEDGLSPKTTKAISSGATRSARPERSMRPAGCPMLGRTASPLRVSPTSRTTMPRAKPTSSWKFMPRSRARPRPKNWLPKSSGCTTSLSVRLALPTTATRARLQA